MYYVYYRVSGFLYADRASTLRLAAARFKWVRARYRDAWVESY
jgi:hypothetical protein